MITFNSSSIKAAVVAVAICLMLATPSHAMGLLHRNGGMAGLPAGAQPLSAQELFELYAGKTWKWGAGGGYFGPNGAFRARTFSDAGVGEGGGTWAVNDKGRLCFRATWISPKGTSARANSCFDHAMVNGDLYQRRFPKGEWYVFRHAVANPADEYNKLVGKTLAAVLAAN
jgi:hypothetical protein